MASDVTIGNRALQKLGAKRITSLSEPSANARAVATAKDEVRQAMLRKHTWNFAKRRASLAADATPPEFGKANAFQLPSDYLRLLPPDPAGNFNNLDWSIEGKKVLTNQGAPLQVRYVADVTDANAMDPLFREAYSTELAIELCEEITQSNTKKEGLRADLRDIMADAKRTNAIEKPAVESAEDSWVTVRS